MLPHSGIESRAQVGEVEAAWMFLELLVLMMVIQAVVLEGLYIYFSYIKVFLQSQSELGGMLCLAATGANSTA